MEWLIDLPRADQFTTILVAAELYAGAYNSNSPDKWVDRIESEILPRLTVLGFDMECARHYGQLRAHRGGTLALRANLFSWLGKMVTASVSRLPETW